jgi:hypothetical protein
MVRVSLQKTPIKFHQVKSETQYGRRIDGLVAENLIYLILNMKSWMVKNKHLL